MRCFHKIIPRCWPFLNFSGFSTRPTLMEITLSLKTLGGLLLYNKQMLPSQHDQNFLFQIDTAAGRKTVSNDSTGGAWSDNVLEECNHQRVLRSEIKIHLFTKSNTMCLPFQ